MKKTILLICSSIAVFNSFSQGFQVNFQGQKQQGMGLAGTALSEDASALFFNPGGVAFVKKSEINGGFSPIFANTLFVDSASGGGYRTKSPMGTPFSAYALFNFKKAEKLKVGLAVYTPFGSTIEYEDAWIGRFALTKLSLKSIYFQPTVSYKITEHFGFGAGFVISTGSVNLQKDIPVQFADGSYAHAELSGKALGFGYNLGLSAKVNEHFSLGLTYRSQVSMKVKKGEATFTVPESLSANFPNGPFTSSLPLPSVLTLGGSYDTGKKWQFVLDINYVGWKSYDTLAFDYETNTASLADTKSARKYKNIFAFRGGVNYKITEMISIRLGGGYGFSPVQNGYLTPESPDNNRVYGTGGLGFKFNEHFNLDLSFYGTKIKRTDRNLESNLNGTFTTIALSPGIGLSYKW
ncbi:OmpP1/FadL family transporter [Fluviicola taffensis]|uniref:Membrane protein involved in aromatic hydrocarbon degradation n=1 Tax=Fluviicola taffensis (strain DSM 16823 / NCIMB 13979 / RW262) TaxID=755732 RepID=F2ICT2_FLUTR|nr:outer membrane protein transport protein [Fluviicola taffensis]AEA43306.1 membrane protein involved in aromatic hydrocarbon degradation [Fluviicola taffensis DSM 16823]